MFVKLKLKVSCSFLSRLSSRRQFGQVENIVRDRSGDGVVETGMEGTKGDQDEETRSMKFEQKATAI